MRLTIIGYLLFLGTLLYAQPTPETVLPLSRAMMPISFYQAQAKLWKAETEKQPAHAKAWVNFYSAARNLRTLGAPAYALDSIINIATISIPNTFEVHYQHYWHSNLTKVDFNELLKAHALAPDRPEIIHDFVHYYELMGDQELFTAYCRKLHQQAWYPPGVLDWNYNALQSVAENAVLLTQGDNDTYPAWVLQEAKGIRPDVSVLNTYLLLLHDQYRQRVFTELGIEQAFEPDTELTFPQQKAALIDHLLAYLSHPLYLGIGTPGTERAKWNEQLYLTGLAFLYSTDYFDKLPVLVDNYEHKFRTESLQAPLYDGPSQSVVSYMNMNYIPTLAMLRDHYQRQGRHAQAEQMKILAFNIAERAGKTSKIRAIFELDSPEPPEETELDLREIEKSMQLIGDQLYASSYETPNAWYQNFRADLQQANIASWLSETEQLPVAWRSLLPVAYRELSDHTLYVGSGGHPSGEAHPVVNISHAAAEYFCEWLTLVYNNSDHRRKRWAKVRFFLPTAIQWEQAARGGATYAAPYPWGGPYNQNSKGCYLGNFNPHRSALDQLEPAIQKEEIARAIAPKYYNGNNEPTTPALDSYPQESPGEDGSYFPALVDSYFPNNYGLYNTFGNVAEMLATPKLSKGGSWADPAYFTSIPIRLVQPEPQTAASGKFYPELR